MSCVLAILILPVGISRDPLQQRKVGLVELADKSQCDMGAFARATLDDGGTYAVAAAGD